MIFTLARCLKNESNEAEPRPICEVISAQFPSTNGSFQVLIGHAPIISTLDEGIVKIKDDNGEHKYGISGGVVEVINNNITVLVESLQSEKVSE
ncbi:MAG: hypothetical protein COC01_05935 [Bacteroidetes bacterium]|nr:MAG: hypothetical protein COC01_05935 [Bacteroidota bacterium]